MSLISMQDGHERVSLSETRLPTGQMMTVEIVRAGPNDYLVTSMMTDGADAIAAAPVPQTCGYCDGQPIGCVTCPNNDPTIDCVQRIVYCRS